MCGEDAAQKIENNLRKYAPKILECAGYTCLPEIFIAIWCKRSSEVGVCPTHVYICDCANSAHYYAVSTCAQLAHPLFSTCDNLTQIQFSTSAVC